MSARRHPETGFRGFVKFHEFSAFGALWLNICKFVWAQTSGKSQKYWDLTFDEVSAPCEATRENGEWKTENTVAAQHKLKKNWKSRKFKIKSEIVAEVCLGWNDCYARESSPLQVSGAVTRLAVYRAAPHNIPSRTSADKASAQFKRKFWWSLESR